MTTKNSLPIKDWSTERAGGPRKVVREDVQAMNTDTPSKLKRILEAGRNLAVTSECGPPRGSDAEEIKKKADMIRKPMWTP